MLSFTKIVLTNEGATILYLSLVKKYLLKIS
jgi:hypothetical protein